MSLIRCVKIENTNHHIVRFYSNLIKKRSLCAFLQCYRKDDLYKSDKFLHQDRKRLNYVKHFQSTKYHFENCKTDNLDESMVCMSKKYNRPDLTQNIKNIQDIKSNPTSNHYAGLYSVKPLNVPVQYSKAATDLAMSEGIPLRDKFTPCYIYGAHPLNHQFVNYSKFSTFTAHYSSSNKLNEVPKKNSYGYGVSRDVMQGVQGTISWPENHTIESLSKLENPCPQGIQGSDCDRFKLWLENCTKYNYINCESQLTDLKEGRKTLAQVFEEQEEQIRTVAADYQNQKKTPVGVISEDSSERSTNAKVSQKDRLKKAVSQYGSTVIVFHVGISLISLGGFYLAVSSGLDVVAILQKIGVGQSILESRLAAGASTFVVAYAVHKVFAPVRIATTLTCTPFIVRYLRTKGILKPPKVTKST